jgi:hypothetical protein
MIIEIEEGLELNNPTMVIKCISYQQDTNIVMVECHFTEESGLYIHSRNYNFNNDGGLDLSYSDVIELMRGNDVLKQFI